MKKLLMLMGALITCNAYGESVSWLVDIPTTQNTCGSTERYDVSACASGNNITKPSNPEKSGYRFIGWREATTEELLAFCAVSFTPNQTGGSNTSWTATFVYGTVRGLASCSSYTGSCNDETNCSKLDSVDSGGKKCWCKVTDLGPFIGRSNGPLKWVPFPGNYSSNSDCLSRCAYACGTAMQWGHYSYWRRHILGL